MIYQLHIISQIETFNCVDSNIDDLYPLTPDIPKMETGKQ